LLGSQLSLPLAPFQLLELGAGVFNYSHAGQSTKSPAAQDLPNRSPQPTSTSYRDTSCEHSDFLIPREQLPTERTDVNLVHFTVSAPRVGTEKAIFLQADGVDAATRAASGKMEDFVSPLDGSDSSNLTPTQENDPSVYIRLQEILARQNISQNSSHGGIGATQEQTINPESTNAQDTGISYAVNDTGHVTIDYQPPPTFPSHDSFDEEEIGEVLSGRLRLHILDGGPLKPQTPAQARLSIGNPGTMMRPSQMFAETQPSPGSRDSNLLPSSSRPTPDVFNQYQSAKQFMSSPLARRINNVPSQNDVVTFDHSSPPESSQLDEDSDQRLANPQLLTERPSSIPNGSDGALTTRPFTHQNFPEPFGVYTSRQESQERRRRQAKALDHDSQSSDDGFSDDEAEMNRRAKRKKEEAAKDLAVVGTPRPGSAGKEIVEVPSTSTGRRRSLAEDYEAQCTGFDARDTQPDTTILDSQSAPAGLAVSLGSEVSQIISADCVSRSVVHNHHLRHHYEEDPAVSGKIADDDSSDQLPGLEQHEDSEATDSEREASNSPTRRPITQPLREVSSNIAELRTPAMHKKLPYIDGDTLIPETSPSEPHVQRYGDIVSQTPPVPSAEEVDDIFNPFSQDMEFNNLIQSPPQRKRLLRAAQISKPIIDPNMETGPEIIEGSRANNSSETGVDPLTTGLHGQPEAAGLTPTATAPEDTSEYITAPTGLASESNIELSTHSNYSVKALSGPTPSASLDKGTTQDLRVNQNDTGRVGLEVCISEVDEPFIPAEVVGDIPRPVRSLFQEGANGLISSGSHGFTSAPAETLGLGNPETKSKRKSKASSRPSKKSSKEGKVETGEAIVDVNPATLAVEPSEVLPNRLRSATQLRGSSRALRRLIEDGDGFPSTPTSTHVTPASTIQKITRSSRRSSANCKFTC
jgi:hypothetical protein